MTLQELMQQREQAWIEKHGQHEYATHDLVKEMEEELADLCNYATAQYRQHTMDDPNRWFLFDVLNHAAQAYSLLQSYRQAISPTL